MLVRSKIQMTTSLLSILFDCLGCGLWTTYNPDDLCHLNLFLLVSRGLNTIQKLGLVEVVILIRFLCPCTFRQRVLNDLKRTRLS
jgi:hypothetical protein